MSSSLCSLAFTLFKKSHTSHVHIPIPGFVPVPDEEIDGGAVMPLDSVIEDSEPAVVLPLPRSSATPLKHDFASPHKRKEGGAKEAGPVSRKLSLDDQVGVVSILLSDWPRVN